MINFKEWLKLQEYAFHNYFGPLTGTGVNDEPFSKAGVRSKYIGPAGTFVPDKTENTPDCLYLKKNCPKKNKRK
jgi:hypothetical protein